MAVAKKIPDQFYVRKYGMVFDPLCDVKGNAIAPMPPWMIERSVLYSHPRWSLLPGNRLLPWEEHFKKFVTHIWGDPNGFFYFEWNPNAERILENFVKHRLLAVAGHASSGKTEAMVGIGVGFYLIDPQNTKVLFTSLTAKSAKGKVWGSVAECWQQACKMFGGEANMPGKLLSSQTIIRYEDPATGNITDKAGLELVVGEASQAKESAEKIQGYKRGKVLLMADELATLAPALLATALSNLKVNEDFRMIGAFNPDSYFDPGGKFSKPKDGWHTISEHSTEWETIIEPLGLSGYCIRFDGETSPNVLACKKIWKGLMDTEYLHDLQTAKGPKTKDYWKMARGFWSPTGSKECIYSEAEIFNYRADAPVNNWIDAKVMVAGLDPAFAHGGDRAILTIGQVGFAKSPDTNEVQKVFELLKIYSLDDDVTDKTQSKSELIVKLLKAKLIEHKVSINNLAVDASGGGDPFSALIARDIGAGFLQVQFGGSPSKKPVSKSDRRPANERFSNKVSELWMVGRELIRTGQLKGLLPDAITDMTSRTFGDDDRKLVAVEPKKKMKMRTQRSPDIFDSVTLCIEVCRQRHGLSSTEKAAAKARATAFPDNELAEMFSWGQKKRPSYGGDYETVEVAGAGWGDE